MHVLPLQILTALPAPKIRAHDFCHVHAQEAAAQTSRRDRNRRRADNPTLSKKKNHIHLAF